MKESKMKNILKTLLAIIYLAVLPSAYAQMAEVLVYGKHVVNPTTKVKQAEYQFEINNLSKKEILGIDIGCYKPNQRNTDIQFTFETQRNMVIDIDIDWKQTIASMLPIGWYFEILGVEGTADYCLELRRTTGGYIPAGKSTKATGQNFIFRLTKLDPQYARAYIKYNFELPLGSVVQARPFDTTAPKFSYTTVTYPNGKDGKRLGWAQVVVTPSITDNYDPNPVALLTSVTSVDKTMTSADVEADFNEEVTSFWVRRAPNRQYSITYTGMDASGNKTPVTQAVWAP